MNALFNLGVKETDRTDIVLALLQGIPGLNQQTRRSRSTRSSSTSATPPAANPNPLGVLGGDTAGFPNGRRLTDDVVDIELRVVAGALIGNNVALGDGVDQNDKPFSTVPVPGAAGLGIRLEAQEAYRASNRPDGAQPGAAPRRARIDSEVRPERRLRQLTPPGPPDQASRAARWPSPRRSR